MKNINPIYVLEFINGAAVIGAAVPIAMASGIPQKLAGKALRKFEQFRNGGLRTSHEVPQQRPVARRVSPYVAMMGQNRQIIDTNANPQYAEPQE